jgi:hypothetical protein
MDGGSHPERTVDRMPSHHSIPCQKTKDKKKKDESLNYTKEVHRTGFLG